MKLFNIFGKSKKSANPDISKEFADKITEIVKIISLDDTSALAKISECLLDVRLYASNSLSILEDRGIDPNKMEIHDLAWICMVECLISCGYAYEFDWECDKDNFIHFLSGLKNFNALGADINPVYLYDDDDIVCWCAVQDEVWHSKYICVGGIDIESDSYVLFVSSVTNIEKLSTIALSINRRIEKGRYM